MMLASAQSTLARASSGVQASSEYLSLADRIEPTTALYWLPTAKGEQFPILIRKNQSPKTFGTVIIIPATGRHADWPGYTTALRNYLPINGWTTVTISMAAHPHQPASREKKSTIPDSQSALTETHDNNELSLTANHSSDDQANPNLFRMNQGITFTSNNLDPPFKLIVEEDNAALALTAMKDIPNIQPNMIILINAHPNAALNDLISQTGVPVIDFVAEQHRFAKSSMNRAKLLSQLQQDNHYFKVIPSALPDFQNQEALLLKNIRGIMERLLP